MVRIVVLVADGAHCRQLKWFSFREILLFPQIGVLMFLNCSGLYLWNRSPRASRWPLLRQFISAHSAQRLLACEEILPCICIRLRLFTVAPRRVNQLRVTRLLADRVQLCARLLLSWGCAAALDEFARIKMRSLGRGHLLALGAVELNLARRVELALILESRVVLRGVRMVKTIVVDLADSL